MSLSDVVVHEPVRHSTFDTIDLPNSLSLGSSVFGTSAASRRTENSCESLYISLMRSRKLEKSGSSFLCSRCVNPNVNGVIRCEDFKLMDIVRMLKLTKKDAASLALDEGEWWWRPGTP